MQCKSGINHIVPKEHRNTYHRTGQVLGSIVETYMAEKVVYDQPAIGRLPCGGWKVL